VSTEPTVTEADLQAYADGRLGAERSAEVESWLAARPEDAERLAAYRRLGEALRAAYDPVLAEPVPQQLEGALTRRPRARRIASIAGWIALGALLGALSGWQAHDWRRPAAPALVEGAAMARRAAIAHATYSPEVRHPVEVGADQEEHLVAWLSKRVGAKVRAPKLDEAGMTLVGGRLLPGENGPVALFMYQSAAGRRLTLYIRAEAQGQRETAFRYARENNVSVFYWIERECGYAISSADLSKDELLHIATLVYKQLEA
jgi:anti-sigma factor RsiW